MPKKSRALLSLLILLTSLSACHHKEEEQTENPTPPPVLTVSLYTVTARPLKKSIGLTGSVQAKELVNIQPAATGLKVMSVLADEGDYVKRGQLLVKLDDRMLRTQLAGARNRLASSGYQYSKTATPVRSQEIARLRAAVNQAEVAVNDAVTNEQRASNLFSQQVITKAELDSRRTALANAQAVLRQQRESLNLALAGSRNEDLQVAKLGVSDARLQIEQLNIQLEQTEVRSPVAGLILARDVSQGSISSFSAPYFTLVKNGQLEFRAQVPEADLHRVPIGAEVELSSDANPNLKASGFVRRLGAVIDQSSRLGTVRIDIAPGSGLKVGQFVRGELKMSRGQNLAVPLKSVINQNGLSQVFTLADGKARIRNVKTGAQSDQLIEVLSGLKANEKIIEDGVGFLKDGDPVKVVPRPAGAKP